jgi:hypothetical protein
MFHFPSTLSLQGTKRPDGNLNATQQKHATQPILLEIEEELHDARRVQSDGQEDDLRCALGMVIKRVTQMVCFETPLYETPIDEIDQSSILSEAYKTQADLEVQLNVAKSNLKLVIANNEMLEDALRQNFSSQSKEVGWNRTSTRNQLDSPKPISERCESLDISVTEPQTTPPADTTSSSTANFSNPFQENGFFGFRFSASYPIKSSTRPGTPSGQNSNSPQLPHLTSPSLPSLTSVKLKEIESLTAELEKEKADRKKILEEKAAIEGDLESLSQALFEEVCRIFCCFLEKCTEINLIKANKMVSDERKMRAEIEEELKELRKEKEALQSAMRVIEGENSNFRSVNTSTAPPNIQPITVFPDSRFSYSSRAAMKSRRPSLELASNYPLPPSPAPDTTGFSPWYEDLAQEENADRGIAAILSPEESRQTQGLRIGISGPIDSLFVEASPWADVPSKPAPSMTETAGTAEVFDGFDRLQAVADR